MRRPAAATSYKGNCNSGSSGGSTTGRACDGVPASFGHQPTGGVLSEQADQGTGSGDCNGAEGSSSNSSGSTTGRACDGVRASFGQQPQRGPLPAQAKQGTGSGNRNGAKTADFSRPPTDNCPTGTGQKLWHEEAPPTASTCSEEPASEHTGEELVVKRTFLELQGSQERSLRRTLSEPPCLQQLRATTAEGQAPSPRQTTPRQWNARAREAAPVEAEHFLLTPSASGTSLHAFLVGSDGDPAAGARGDADIDLNGVATTNAASGYGFPARGIAAGSSTGRTDWHDADSEASTTASMAPWLSGKVVSESASAAVRIAALLDEKYDFDSPEDRDACLQVLVSAAAGLE